MGFVRAHALNEQDVAAYTRRWTRRSYVLGLDLGQSVDPTAIAVVERLETPRLHAGQLVRFDQPLDYAVSHGVRHLERLPLKMPYPDQVAQVARLLETAPLRGNCRLVIDMTGVGRPVFDLFRQARLKPVGVTITGGDGESRDGDAHRVSKLLLVSRLQAMLHSGELKIAANLSEAPVLVAELQDFRANVSERGHASFGARVGRHDDLVLAVAIACWWAVKRHASRATVQEFQV